MSPSVATRENREFASEIKFRVPPMLAAQIRAWARQNLMPDPHAGGASGDTYQITSLYFDNPRMDVFHRRGSFGRSKYRIRRYGSSEVVFFERKLKTKGLVTKRRSIVPITELALLHLHWADPTWAGYWLRRRLELRQMSPVCQISYERTARVGMTSQGPIRITLDEDLRATAISRAEFNGHSGCLLSSGFAIMEMKFLFAVPALFKNLIAEFALNPEAFSKYRYAAHRLGLAQSVEWIQSELAQPTSVYA